MHKNSETNVKMTIMNYAYTQIHTFSVEGGNIIDYPIFEYYSHIRCDSRHDRKVVGFTSTYAVNVKYRLCCEFDTAHGNLYVIQLNFASYL